MNSHSKFSNPEGPKIGCPTIETGTRFTDTSPKVTWTSGPGCLTDFQSVDTPRNIPSDQRSTRQPGPEVHVTLLALAIAALTLLSPAIANAQQPEFSGAGFAKNPGRLVGWGKLVNDEAAETIPSGRSAEGFIQVSAFHTAWAALNEDGSIFVHGAPKPEKRDIKAPIVKIAIIPQALVAIDEEGRGYSWEREDQFDVQPAEPLEDLVDITLGLDQAYALTRGGRLIWWGKSRALVPAFTEIIAPYQGHIVAISSGDWGGSLITDDGRFFHWHNFDNPPRTATGTVADFARGPRGIEGAGNRFSYPKADGTWKSLGTLPLPQDHRADVVLHSRGCLTAARDEAGSWSIFDDGKFSNTETLRTFITQSRPSAIAFGGYHQNFVPTEKRTLGAIAIVPMGMDELSKPTPQAESTETAMETATRLPAPIELPADHGITDPRFLAFLKLYEAELQSKAQTAFDQSLATLNTKLDTALEREEKKAISAGDLDKVTAYRAERERLSADEIPATDPETNHPTIQRFRTAWRAERAKIDAQRALDTAPVRESFEEKLAELEKTLTTEEKIDEALKVRAFREKLVPPSL